jgi:hypothetical protein
MATWGVLRLPAAMDAARGAEDGAPAAGLGGLLDGLVAVAADASPQQLLALLPPSVTRIVELDPETVTAPDAGERVAALLTALPAGPRSAGGGPHSAVVSARPLADALKRVDGDRVVEGLMRDGLLTPVPPSVIDRAALAAALHAPGAADARDAVGLLLAAGHAVLVVPDDGEPLTVRSERPA